MKRYKVILARWISLIFCGVVAAALWGLIGQAVQRFLDPVSEYLASMPSGLLSTSVLIVAIAACWPFGRRRWTGFFGIPHLATYPPLWIALVVAVASIALYAVYQSGWNIVLDSLGALMWLLSSVPLWFWAASVSAIAIYVAISRFVNRPATVPKATAGDLSDYEALVQWIRDDREITRPSQDKYGHNAVAVRIVRRLTSEGESPTMAVVGPLGSGKSTIGKLVKHHLKEHRSVLMLHISLWPFDSAEAAVVGILDAAIRKLGDRVNTLAISGLSERYTAIIEKADSFWGAFARYMRGSSDPKIILDSLGGIASAAGLKLVLWIEDLERFAGTEQIPNKDTSQEKERVGPILSLLNLLDRCDSISVIVCDNSLQSRFDVSKIARFVERPPSLATNDIWNQIVLLRSRCLNTNFIDPASKNTRSALTPPSGYTSFHIWAEGMRDDKPNIGASIAIILETPRSFKSALRITWETWEKLPGEIDFDSVLVASILKVARPNLFVLIEKHINKFRNGFKDPWTFSEAKPQEDEALTTINLLLNSEDGKRKTNAVKALIDFLFPIALTKDLSGDEYINRPQGLDVNRHTDYWDRYLSLPDVEEDLSDQAALHSIAAWKNGEENDLVSRTVHPERSGQIETFVGQFSPEDLCRLLIDTAIALREASASTWRDGEHAPGITSIWRMMHNRQPRVDVLADTVSNALSKVVAHHLPLANDIYYFFAHDGQSRVPSLLDDLHRNRVLDNLRGLLTTVYHAGSGQQLLQSLRGGSPWVVWHLCMQIAPIHNSEPPFDEWTSLSDALMAAAEIDLTVGLPLIVPFFTSSNLGKINHRASEAGPSEPVRSWVGAANLDQMRELFDFDRLAPLLAKTPPPEGLDSQMWAQYEAARSAATKYLNGLEVSQADVPLEVDREVEPQAEE